MKGFHRANAGRYWPPISHIHLQRIDTFSTFTLLCIIVSTEKNLSRN
jgi:hypothetical protein